MVGGGASVGTSGGGVAMMAGIDQGGVPMTAPAGKKMEGGRKREIWPKICIMVPNPDPSFFRIAGCIASPAPSAAEIHVGGIWARDYL